MKNGMKRGLGIVSQVGGLILSLIAMHVCVYTVQLGPMLYDDEMPFTLALPVIMMLPALIIYLIWFGSKAKKFTDGTYPDYSSKYYGSVLMFIVTIIVQFLLGFVATLPMFLPFMSVCVQLIPNLLISWIFLVIADVLCFWVFKPVANDF